MKQPSSYLLPHLQKIVRRDSADLRGSYVRLDRNERVSPLKPDEYQKLIASLSPNDFTMYPDPKPLQDRLCRDAGLPDGWALLTNGSDNAIRRIIQASVMPNDIVGFPSPTYEMYAVYADLFQARRYEVPYGANRQLDVETLIETIGTAKMRLLCLANPDQPTGSTIDVAALSRIAQACLDANTLLLVDEAYWAAGRETALSIAKRMPNCLVVRSYSKVIGFGGVRLGAIFGRPDLIDLAVRVKGLHEVNSIALAVGRFVADHPEIVASYFAETEEGRSHLIDICRLHQIRTPSCPPMFQLLEFSSAQQAVAMAGKLKEKGWLVRGGFAAECLKNCLRVSLADAATMAAFGASLASAMGESP
jgi:histidinol-phosphate aminotransferase